MATCLDTDRYPNEAADFLTYGFSAVPLRGGMIAQAAIQDEQGPAKTVGMPLLHEGDNSSATCIVEAMTDSKADGDNITYLTLDGELTYPLYELRQYGVVTYDESNPAAAYTGSSLTPLYSAFGFLDTEETSLTSATDDYVISVQGNIVFPGTVEATFTAFEDSNEGNFAVRLFKALEKGYTATGGDVRCAYNENLKGAVLAFLKVMEPSGSYSIDLVSQFGESQNKSALDSIDEDLNTWLLSLESPNQSLSSIQSTDPTIASLDSSEPPEYSKVDSVAPMSFSPSQTPSESVDPEGISSSMSGLAIGDVMSKCCKMIMLSVAWAVT
ncbi:hypothetical protein ACHAWF_003281 [Thalassiosira exigua]